MNAGQQEFERLTESLAIEVQSANIDYKVYRGLCEAISKHEREFSQSTAFWTLTFDAHLNSCLFRLCRIYDRQKSSLHLSYWLRTIKSNLAWFGKPAFDRRCPTCEYHGAPDEPTLLADIAFADPQQNPLVKNLQLFRGNVVAHIGRKFSLRDKQAPSIFRLTHADVKKLATEAMKIVNRYSQLYNGHTYSTKMVGADDYQFVLDSIAERLDRQNSRETA